MEEPDRDRRFRYDASFMDAAPATRRSLLRAPRWLPKGWPDFFLQLALFAIVDVLYELTRGLSEGSVATAFAHAR